jgi:hypothetical protein
MNDSEKKLVTDAIAQLDAASSTLRTVSQNLSKLSLTPQGTPVVVATARTSSGVHVSGHSIDEARAFQTWRGLPLDHLAVFPTRNGGPTGLANTWFIPPKDLGTAISIALPMAYEEGSLNDDLTVPFTSIANALKADGRLMYLRLGWEFNIPWTEWQATDGNLTQWRNRYSQYYSLFKNILGVKALIGLNPNVGNQQTGISGEWVSKVWVDGKVDWVGIDAYDCWEPFTTQANIDDQLNRTYGLRWWSNLAISKKLPLALPEWGVSSGYQWAGHQGNDNPTYITEIDKFLKEHQSKGGTVLFQSYFSERADYVKSALPDQNPKAGAKYKTLFGA